MANVITGICERMSDHVRSVIVHSDRDFDADLKCKLSAVEFIRWPVGREIGLQDISALCKLRKIVREVDPDVIHLHSSKAGALGRAACAFMGRRVLYTPHSYAFLRRDVSQLKRSLYRFIEWSLSKLAVTLACGLEEYGIARRMAGPVALIPNSVDFEIFRRAGATALAAKRAVIAVGRICPQKDFGFFRAIARQMPDTSFIWVSGQEGDIHPVESNILVIGKVRASELASLYESAAVFLNTSLWEGLSKAVIEACAMGLPLVLRNVPGNRELPYLGADAWIFNSRDECVSQISEALRYVEKNTVSSKNIELARRFFCTDGHEIEAIYHAESLMTTCVCD